MRNSLTLLISLTLVAASPVCGPIVFPSIKPGPGAVVTTSSFQVEIEVNEPFVVPGTLSVRLNGVPLAMSGGPTVFTATVNPGGALQDENVITVRTDLVSPFISPAARVIHFEYQPPKARAGRITDPGELIEGPLAHGRLGDWLIENDVVRFVIQDGPQRDLYSIGQFGGNVIDAERVVGGARQGNDNFFEMQPAVNIESVINADVVEVVNDGQNGLAAEIRACGPDDLMDFVNASSQVSEFGVNPPAGTDDTDLDLDGCTSYRLAPGDSHLSVETTLTYNSGPRRNLFAGDYLNGAGELEQWTSNSALEPSAARGIGEVPANASFDVLSFVGFGQGTGTSYNVVARPVAGSAFPTSSSFTTSGVSFVLAGASIPLVLAGFNSPTFRNVDPGQSRSFTRLFHVGDGSASGAVDLLLALDGVADEGTLEGVVRVGGVPVAGARVAAGTTNAAGTAITDLRSVWVTDADGAYSGKLPAGSYGVVAGLEGVPFQGGGATPVVNAVTITAGLTTQQDVDLPATGRVRVEVVDVNDDPVPARVSVVGFDPSPEPTINYFEAGLSANTGVLRDVSKDNLDYGLVWIAYADANGVAEFDLDPGTYEIFVSRGTEYALFQQSLTVTAGPFGEVTETVNAQIVRVVDSPGFVSSDYHVHMIDSPDSRISRANRIYSIAGEGVDNIIATDHDVLTDLIPLIGSLGMTPFVHATIGEEITTFDYGHFNSYPQALDPAVPSKGATDFGGAAPVGEDFPSLGAYNLTPAQIHDEARTKTTTAGGVQNAGLTTVVHVNHIDSHFQPLRIDTAQEPPTSLLDPTAFDAGGRPTAANPLFFRLDPTVANFANPAFEGLELWNGSSRGAQEQFLLERMGIWMNLLNQGLATTFIADTDTHTFLDIETAGARTWTPVSGDSDAPSAILDNDIGTAIDGGKATGGQGIYVQTRLVDTETANEANLTWNGSTLVTATDGTVTLEIDVQAPTWAPYDTIEIYQNAQTCRCSTGRCNNLASSGVPVVLYSALPSNTLTAGVNFSVETEAGVEGGSRLRTQVGVPLALLEDTWVVVIVKGTPGTSAPMFPVYPDNLSAGQNPNLAALLENTAGESGTRALGATNALYVDVDGDGAFDPPGCAGRCNASICPAS